MTSEKTRLAELIRKIRTALAEPTLLGQQAGDDSEAIASQRQLFTAALQELTPLAPNADDATIRAAIERASRWIDAATTELDADERGEWKRAGEEGTT